MNQASFKYVFGPALSRRLGRSLGVDVIPFKTCSYDCVYCQLGPTSVHTVQRRPYVPLADVLEEIRTKIQAGVQADYITIGGSGEPTLYSEIGALIEAIKKMTDIPVAVITNGSMLWAPTVRRDLNSADLVMPSLDAATAEAFVAENRPVEEITFERMVGGLEAFRNEYRGQIWLEIFLLAPIGPDSPQIAAFAAHLARIRPDKIHLNTVTRPAPGGHASPVPKAVMEQIAQKLGPHGEVIADYPSPGGHAAHATPEDVFGLLLRHPCSAKELAAGLAITPEEAQTHIDALLAQGKITPDRQQGAETAYIVKKQQPGC